MIINPCTFSISLTTFNLERALQFHLYHVSPHSYYFMRPFKPALKKTQTNKKGSISSLFYLAITFSLFFLSFTRANFSITATLRTNTSNRYTYPCRPFTCTISICSSYSVSENTFSTCICVCQRR